MRPRMQPVFIAAITMAGCTIDFPDRDVSGRYACASVDDCMRDYACVLGKCVAEYLLCAASRCDINASCADTAQGAVCTCNPGYVGDGRACDVLVPTVSSFTAAPVSVGPGGAVTLTAVFDAGPGGTATVDQGVGTIASGVAKSSGSLAASTTFTLTVSTAIGTKVTAQVRVLAGALSVLAGVPSGNGNVDGTGTAARFYEPSGVAVDAAGNVYVADTGNHTIRKITSEGVVSTLAGSAGPSGSADGTGTAARFDGPVGVAVDTAGNVYVADTHNCTIRKITPDGVVSTMAGSAGQHGSADGTGGSARFYYPESVAVDTAGTVYVADTQNHTIRKITSEGVVSTLAGSAGEWGSADGTGAVARFGRPTGAAVDTAGNVYVADNSYSTIRKITSEGVVTTLAGSAGQHGSADGAGAAARFRYPAGMAVDAAGNVYVADTHNDTIRKIMSGGVVTTLAGSAGEVGIADGAGAVARFYVPIGVAVDTAGNVYVADSYNHTIRKITPVGMVSTLAGSAGQVGSTDGTGAAARFRHPVGVAVDAGGNVYVADTWNYTIRKITSDGVVSTLAGSAGQSGSADGTGATARFGRPHGVAVDAAGNLYVADTYSHTIRRITTDGAVSTLAGSAGEIGSADGTGAAARFYYPYGVAVDAVGNVYVADTGNHTIRKVTADGVVTTIIGSPSWGINLPGDLTARVFRPNGVAVSPSSNNLYVVLEDAVLTAPY